MTTSASSQSAKRVFLGVSGASGSLYAVRTLQMLVEAECEIALCFSSAARRVLWEECQIRFDKDPAPLLLPGQSSERVRVHAHGDIGAPPASGTAIGDVAMVVPCSLSTLSGIAQGSASNLIERASQVALKEQKSLILVPRETPLSRTHLDQMSRLAWAGATMLPACPGFYHRPDSIEALVDHVCAKILNVADIPQSRVAPWGG